MNAERYLKPPETMARLFSDLPQALAGTEALAERLEFTLANLGYRFPDYPVPAGETQASFLRRLAQVGARDRYRPYHDRARAQIARELDLIEKLDLAGYFLIVWDIVNFCRQQGILVQGRGSAANSAVCYALGITAVDPVGMELLFERFLSEERGEWPDIDLDLPSGDQRERVIQYVYERYGKLGAAMTANVITYRGRSAAREVGKVLGLAEDEIDRLARLMSQFEFVDPEETLARNLREAGLDPDDRALSAVRDGSGARCRTCRAISASTRAAWSSARAGSTRSCRSRTPSMPGRVVVQWDKDDCADLGIVKVDLLGLGMMAVLEEAIAIVNDGQAPHSQLEHCELRTRARARSSSLSAHPRSSISRICRPTTRPSTRCCRRPTRSACSRSSRARRWRRCRGCKPEHFYDLVVEVAIIRPGPIVGNMVHPYLRAAARRRAGDLRASAARAGARSARWACRCSRSSCCGWRWSSPDSRGGEAEELRRAMGFKRSVKRMQQIETRLRDGMAPQRHHRRGGRSDRAVDHVVRAVRLSRIARRELRADRLRERVSEGALPGGVLHGAPQQPADGVLSPGDAGQGRAAARRAVRAGGRAGLDLELLSSRRTARSGGAAVREGTAGRGGTAD